MGDRASSLGKGRVLVFAVSAGVGLGLGLYVLDGTGLLPVNLPASIPASPWIEPPPTEAPRKVARPAEAAAAAPPSSSQAPEPPASSSAPPAAAAAAPGVAPTACLGGFFPEGTFSGEPPVSFICEEADAVASASRLKTAIVVAGRGRAATAGMKEWAVLGFYELAALATMRGACCAGAPPLTAPESAEPCGKMGDTLGAIATASATGQPAGQPAGDREAAVRAFDKSVRCLMKFRQTPRFGYEPLLGSEASTFEKIAARIGSGGG